VAGSSTRRLTPAELTAAVNPSTRRRLVTTLAFPLLILLAVPFWWYTTSIVRLPLPIDRIEALELSTVSLPGFQELTIATTRKNKDFIYSRPRFISSTPI
jgi:hypothetical protein